MPSLIYAVSRWNNPSRPRARHLDNGQGQPLCGERRAFSWEREEGEPTCARCIRQAEAAEEDEPLDWAEGHGLLGWM